MSWERSWRSEGKFYSRFTLSLNITIKKTSWPLGEYWRFQTFENLKTPKANGSYIVIDVFLSVTIMSVFTPANHCCLGLEEKSQKCFENGKVIYIFLSKLHDFTHKFVCSRVFYFFSSQLNIYYLLAFRVGLFTLDVWVHLIWGNHFMRMFT